MADVTYPLCYQKQGSTEWVIQSSGLFTVEDGGEATIQSGGLLQVESGGEAEIESGGTLSIDGNADLAGNFEIEDGGYIAVSTGGDITWPVTGATSSASGSTTLTTLTNNGVSFITSSGDVRKLTLDLPVAGCVKDLFFTAGSTGAEIYISAGVAGFLTMGGDSTAHLLVWEGTTNGAAATNVRLVGKSTTRWIITGGNATSYVIASTSS